MYNSGIRTTAWSVWDIVLSSSCRRVDDVISIRRHGSRKSAEKMPTRARDRNAGPDYSMSVASALLEQSAANLNHRTTCLPLTSLQWVNLSSSWM